MRLTLLTLIPLACARPLVLWHGLGDSHASPGMLDFAARIKEIMPAIFIHSVYIDHDNDNDRRAGFVRSQPSTHAWADTLKRS